MPASRTAQPCVSGHQRQGYLVPLHEDGEIARSYLFAVGSTPPAGEELPNAAAVLAAFVEGFGAPWRNGEEVRRFALTARDLAALPENMLLREQIVAADWASQAGPSLVPQEFILNTGRGVVLAREDVPALRKTAGVRADGVPVSWYPTGPIWKGARALLLLDLDEHALGLAEATTRYVLGDFWTASGLSPVHQAARRGQTQAWDVARGVFFSPEETQRHLDEEQAAAAERIGRRHYGASVTFARTERRSMQTALRARAGQSGRSVGAEWRDLRQAALREVLAQTATDQLGDFDRELAAAPAGPQQALRRRFPALLAHLVAAARRGLQDLVPDRLLGPGWRQRWFQLSHRPALPEPRAEEWVIGTMERDRLIAALKPTPVEQDLIEALEHRVPLTIWADEQKILLSDARKLLDDLRRRLRAATS